VDTATALWILVPLAALHLALARSRPTVLFLLLVDVGLLLLPLRHLAAGTHLGPGITWAAPWGAPTTVSGSIEQADLPLQFAVWWEEVRRLVAGGDPPWVSERLGGGTPLLAHGQSGVPFPLHLPVWVLGAERGSDVMAVWKLALAALGTFLLLRRVGVRPAACGAAALAYAFGPFMLSWMVVPLGWVAAAGPWALRLALGALRGRRLEAAGLAILLGILAGWSVHPESTAFLMAAVALSGAVLGWGRRQRVARLLPPLLLAGAVAAVGALPTLAAIADSAKLDGARAGPQYPGSGVTWALRGRLLALLLVPWRDGHPADGSWSRPFAAAAVSVGAGAATVALLAAAPLRRRHRRLALATALVGVLAAMLLYQVEPPAGVLARLPVLGWMVWSRAAFLVPLALAVAAALAADSWLRRPRPVRLAVVAAGIQAIVVLLVVTAPSGASPRTWWQAWAPAALAASAPVLAAGGGWLLPVIALSEAAASGSALVPTARYPRRAPELVAALAARTSADPGRVLGLEAALPANLAARFGLDDLRCNEPMRPRLLARLHQALGSEGLDLPGPVTRPWPGLAGAWGVRWLATPAAGLPAEAWGEGWREAGRTAAGRLYANPRALPPTRLATAAVAPPGDPRDGGWEGVDFATTAVVEDPPALRGGGTLEVVEARPWRVAARVVADGEVLAIQHTPRTAGWRVTIDGRAAPLLTANLAAMAAVVPAGDHRVEFEYAPSGLRAGAAITVAGLLGCAALARRRRRR